MYFNFITYNYNIMYPIYIISNNSDYIVYKKNLRQLCSNTVKNLKTQSLLNNITFNYNVNVYTYSYIHAYMYKYSYCIYITITHNV